MATVGLAPRGRARGSRRARPLPGGVLAVRSPRRLEPTPVPTPEELHVLNRLGCGFSADSFAALRTAGGARAWIEQQLAPESVAESTAAAALPSWFPSLQDPPATMWRHHHDDVHRSTEYARDLSNLTLLRRIYSNRSLLESMTELWSNHLHVESTAFPAFAQRPAYDEVVRRHALGRFDDLLVATTLHPAMLLYLDGWSSGAESPHEGHARVLLQHHTVGAAAATDDAVRDVARILSGHTVVQGTWTAAYDPARHTPGAVDVLGFRDLGTAPDAALAPAFLRHLARHPATARRVAGRLAARFVSDTPSPALVERLADAYLAADTDLAATLRVLVDSAEFWDSAGRKARTPADDVVATCRALGVEVRPPVSSRSFVHEISWALGSILVHQWPRPEGPPDTADAWPSGSRLLSSWRLHGGLAGGVPGGADPEDQATFPRPVSFLPRRRLRFDAFVDHLSRTLLGRPATASLLRTACLSCEVEPETLVTRDHPLLTTDFATLAAVLLDSPAHMTR